MTYKEVRENITKKLLFKFDPERDLVEIKVNGRVIVVDLNGFRNDFKPKVLKK